MPVEWTQPDGTKLSLRVFGDEFYARTETTDGYTVVFDPATKSYEYAKVSPDGKELLPTKVKVGKGKGKGKALGLRKRLDIAPEARKAKAKARHEKWDNATGNSRRWAEIKAGMQAEDAKKLQAPKFEGGDSSSGTTQDGPSYAPPSFATVGSKQGFTLLIDFSDDPATIPQAGIVDFLNGDNYTGYGNNGSVKKYFQDNSGGLLTYTNVVTAYVRMAQPKSFYNDTTKETGGQGNILIKDALDILKALPNYTTEILPTLNDLTVDSNNRAVAFNVFYAGGNGGVWAKGLWPHSSALNSVGAQALGNGKSVYKYQLTNIGTSLSIGTFCHENGHMLCGYPDIYDYEYDSTGGAGGFCLMNSGGHGTNPVLINAYLRRASGWTTTTEVNSSSNITASLTATVGNANFNKIYRYANPAAPTTEYFLFENRQKTGRDANIAASGIAIWHIDQLGDRDNQSLVANTTHANYECSLIQADNLWHFQSNTNAGDSKDLYYLGNTAAGYTNTFSDNSAPYADWWSGAASGCRAFNFSSAAATMTFQFGLPANTMVLTAPNGGENFYLGSTQNIIWNANITGNVKIELFKGGSLHTVLSASEANDGIYSWVVSSALPQGADYTIKISSVDNPSYSDTSEAVFSLTPQATLADALDTTGITWTTSGDLPWFAQEATTHDGVDAAQSGDINNSQATTMETTVTGPGTLTFWWKVSSESNWDYLTFYLNGVEQTGSLAKISGDIDWVQKTVTLPAGSHTLKWEYKKDGSVSSGLDTAWVDQVVFTPATAPEIVVEQPVGTDLTDGSASINFGPVNTGGSYSAFTFTIRNTGDANLTGLAITKDGTHSADYTVSALGATTLAPAASTTFRVTFTPGAAGTRTAAIHIASNDADENPFDINLTGSGIGPGTLAVSPAGGLTSSGTFGGGFSPSSLQFTLSNPGGTSINWTAAKTKSWVTLSATGGTLAAGANTTVTATINSSANTLNVGSYGDTVTFTNSTNGSGNTTRAVSLAVNPIAATVNLSGLLQTYDGSPKPVTVGTTPSGLAYSVTYGGSSTAPTNAGTYAVVATITEPNHVGGATGDLVISKAAQTITFEPIGSVGANDDPFPLIATASSGLPISYASSNPAVASVSGGIVTPVAVGSTTITASQAGDANFEPAPDSLQTLSVLAAGQIAIGGVVTYVDGHFIHTFTENGTFEVTGGAAVNVEVLVVGGGGGGGSSTTYSTAGAGGGGAGGLIHEEAVQVTGSAGVVIGTPGAAAGSGNTPGSNGGNSQFGSLVALGGGGGSGGNVQGLAGGSGGGSRGNANGGAGLQPGSTSGGFGNPGGGWTSGAGDGAGGGGGAGQAAPSAPPLSPKVGGPGGNGLAYNIGGSLAYYAGGGGGGGSKTSAFGSGGQGGGGNGANDDTAPTPGAPNTGGGGGGGNNTRTGAAGGSGIVIVRYPALLPAPYESWAAAAGLTGDDSLRGTIQQPDGLTNLQKFAFGLDPSVPSLRPVEFITGGAITAPGKPTLMNFAPAGQPDDNRAVFTRRKDHAAAGLVYTVEFSGELGLWTASNAIPAVLTDPNSADDIEVVSVPFPASVPPAAGVDPLPPKFFRIGVTEQ